MPEHLSNYAVTTFLKCPKQWEFRYVDKLQSPSNPSFIRGNAVHAGLEYNFRSKISTGLDLAMTELEAVYDSAWQNEIKDNEIDWQDKSPDDTKQSGLKLLRCYMADQASYVMPTHVEKEFEIKLPGLLDYTFKGRIDLITDKGVVVDFKTSDKKKNEAEYHVDLQATAYSAYMFSDPTLDVVNCEYHVMVNNVKPLMQPIRTTRTMADVDWWIKNILCKMVMQIRTGIFPPCDPTNWWCSKKCCGFYDRCKGCK